jgi:hypothetical protein
MLYHNCHFCKYGNVRNCHIGIMALTFMIRFPLTEGGVINLDLSSIYSDQFIMYKYVVFTIFFVVLYQTFQLLRYIGQNKVFSLNSVKTLRTVKYCAIMISISIITAVLSIMIYHNMDDDLADFIAIGILTTFISVIIATVATMFEWVIQNAINKKMYFG